MLLMITSQDCGSTVLAESAECLFYFQTALQHKVSSRVLAITCSRLAIDVDMRNT